jgi:hypothetical protein
MQNFFNHQTFLKIYLSIRSTKWTNLSQLYLVRRVKVALWAL